jgi:hypothetical protein
MGWIGGVLFLSGARNISLLHRVQTAFGAHPASYPVGTGGSLSGMKLITHFHLVSRSRMMVLYFHYKYVFMA